MRQYGELTESGDAGIHQDPDFSFLAIAIRSPPFKILQRAVFQDFLTSGIVRML